MKQGIGWALVVIGAIFVAVEIDDARKHVSHDSAVGLTMAAFCLGGGAALVRAGRREAAGGARGVEGAGSAAGVSPSVAEAALPVANVVLRVAQRHKGRVTAAEVAAETSVSFDHARAALEKLAGAGACAVDVGEAGIKVFVFPEFESEDAKRDLIA